MKLRNMIPKILTSPWDISTERNREILSTQTTLSKPLTNTEYTESFTIGFKRVIKVYKQADLSILSCRKNQPYRISYDRL